MANIEEVYKSNSQWLKAADLAGGKPVVEIESAELMENNYNGETKTQVVLTFVGKEKKLGLNVTNARRITQLLGTGETDHWVGYRIRLFVDQTEMEGKGTVDCIRVFPDLPEQNPSKAKAATVSSDSDSIPF